MMILSSRARVTLRSNRLLILALAIISLYSLVLYARIRSAKLENTLTDIEEAEMGTVPMDEVVSNSRVLLVSALFFTPDSESRAGNSQKEHDERLNNFFSTVTTDRYLYTTPELAEMLHRLWEDYSPPPGLTINASYSSPFNIPPFRRLEGKYKTMFANNKAKNKDHYSPELSAFWNAKPFFLDSAVKQLAAQGKEYDYVFWADADSFNMKNGYTEWPSPGRVEQVWEEGHRVTGRRKADILFLPIFRAPDRKFRTWREGMGPVVNSSPSGEGSFFGGSPATIEWFSKTFYAYHDQYLSLGFFVGVYQDILNAVVLLFPERIFTVWINDPLAPAHRSIDTSLSFTMSREGSFLGECGNESLYYQFWLSDRLTRDMLRMDWLKQERWRWWAWWKSRKLCRVTRATSMLDVLSRSFGDKWQSPSRSIAVGRGNAN